MTRAIGRGAFALALAGTLAAAPAGANCTANAPNGILEPGEQCDDGNQENGDCCTGQCTFPCDDHQFCTVDTCIPLGPSDHRCDHDTVLPAGTPCTPQDNPCKAAQCSPNGRCGVSLPDGTPCPSDGDACTLDECSRGRCGVAVSCDDDNPCTIDACDPAVGCTHLVLADHWSCRPDPCQIGTCMAGLCTNVGPLCDDHSPCTEDRCNNGHCGPHLPVNDGATCNEGNPCIPTGTCVAGACSAETCGGTARCSTDGTPCDDGNACSPDDVCASGRCIGVCPEPCPTDGVACDDGTDCSPSSICSAGQCTAESCNVGMPCFGCGLTCQPDPCGCHL